MKWRPVSADPAGVVSEKFASGICDEQAQIPFDFAQGICSTPSSLRSGSLRMTEFVQRWLARCSTSVAAAGLGRLAEGEDRAAGVGEDPVDGVVAGEALKRGALHGSENDEAGLQFRCGGEDLNRRVAVGDAGFDMSAYVGFPGFGLSGQRAQGVHGGGIEAGG